MLCPECQREETKVVDTSQNAEFVYRRRECLECYYRFTTYEIQRYKLANLKRTVESIKVIGNLKYQKKCTNNQPSQFCRDCLEFEGCNKKKEECEYWLEYKGD